LTAQQNFQVDIVNGNDANDGLAAGAGNAWKTLQGAYNNIVAHVYSAGNTLVVQSAAGIDTGGLVLNVPWNGGGVMLFAGDTGTPDNCKITNSSSVININTVLPGVLGVQGYQLYSTGGGYAILHAGAGQVNLTHLDFGAAGDNSTGHMVVQSPGAQINMLGPYSIAGTAAAHLWSISGGLIRCNNQTCTIKVACSFGSGFARASEGGIVQSTGMTWVNKTNATGTYEYTCFTGGIVNTAGGGATYFPGDSGGFNDGTGVYA
jgi:hypothetical protein